MLDKITPYFGPSSDTENVLETKVPLKHVAYPVVAFRAERTVANNVGPSFKSPGFDTFDYNYGSMYSNPSGISTITAPYSGIYSITINIFTEGASTTRFIINLDVTGSGASYGGRIYDSDLTRHRRANGTWEGYLPKGATVLPTCYSASTVDIDDNETWIAGRLIAATNPLEF